MNITTDQMKWNNRPLYQTKKYILLLNRTKLASTDTISDTTMTDRTPRFWTSTASSYFMLVGIYTPTANTPKPRVP